MLRSRVMVTEIDNKDEGASGDAAPGAKSLEMVTAEAAKDDKESLAAFKTSIQREIVVAVAALPALGSGDKIMDLPASMRPNEAWSESGGNDHPRETRQPDRRATTKIDQPSRFQGP